MKDYNIDGAILMHHDKRHRYISYIILMKDETNANPMIEYMLLTAKHTAEYPH